MNIVDRLRHLIADQYGLTEVQLQPMPQFAVLEDRGIYRIERACTSPLLVRAYRQDEREGDWLTARAATLRFLEQADYPAPRVIPTLEGSLVGRVQGWDTLMVSFVEGTMAGGSLDDFRAIGAILGQLHRLDPHAAATAIPPVPPARWQPTTIISGWIKDLTKIADAVPPDLQGVHAFSLETLRRVEQWADMPMAITHTDCWANNAIRTPSEQMVLIDGMGQVWGRPFWMSATC